MIRLFSFFLVLIFQVYTVYTDCPFTEICSYDKSEDAVICNGNLGNQSEDDMLPPLACYHPAEEYFFSNFEHVQANAFEGMKFLTNDSITIYLYNITNIDTNAFSASMVIPNDSKITIYIEHPNNVSSLSLQVHAFNHPNIERLHFVNINSFNGQSIFDTHCFSSFVQINELIFEQCNLTGFTSSGRQPANIEQLSIRKCPSLKQLTAQSLPTFLGVTKTLELSGTGLEFIDHHTFQGWSVVFQELLITNNIHLKNFSTDIVTGFLMDLDTLDLSNNSINFLEQNPDWSPYYHMQSLILKQQQKLDLFLKSNILKDAERLTTIDFSQGLITVNDEDLIQNYVPDMPNLSSMNISYTNFTENMIIDLLTRISHSANQMVEVSLLGQILNDTNFCSYFKVFQQSPNLLHLELDEKHECNCVVDLFFDDEHLNIFLNYTLIQPVCLLNTTRARCDIQSQLSLSKCSVRNSNSGDTYGDLGSYAFIGIMAGLAVVLIALLALGSSVVYRARRSRRNTILDMENPIDNPSTMTVEQPIENPSIMIVEEPIENPSSDIINEPLENSF